MYAIFLVLHSLMRWLVLGSLVYAMYTAILGIIKRNPFTHRVNSIRHWTATIAHVQLTLGLTIYFQSPIVKNALPDNPATVFNEQTFFKYVHIALMLIAVVAISIGSARAKPTQHDLAKYRTMFFWFAAGLIIILIAIPWPFSPLAQRPYWRTF